MNRKILLIRTKSAMTSPMGMPYPLLSIATVLSNNGYEVDIIDSTISDTATYVKKYGCQYSIIGFSVYSPTIKDALELTRIAKNVNPKVVIVWGGYQCKIEPVITIRYPLIDFVVYGEGELTMLNLVKHICANHNDIYNDKLNDINGLYYRGNEGPVFTGHSGEVDLDELPPLNYNLINLNDYLKDGKLHIDLNIAMNCKGACTFCADRDKYHKYHAASADSIKAKINNLVEKHNPYHIYLRDDALTNDPDKLMAIVSFIKENKFNFKWSFSTLVAHTRRLTDDMFREMKESGLDNIRIGAESGSEEMRKRIKKPYKREDIVRLNYFSNKYDFALCASYIFGMVGETRKDLYKTQEEIYLLKMQNVKNFGISLTFYQPYNGTPMFREFVDRGIALFTSLEEMGKYYDHMPIGINRKLLKYLELNYFDCLYVARTVGALSKMSLPSYNKIDRLLVTACNHIYKSKSAAAYSEIVE